MRDGAPMSDKFYEKNLERRLKKADKDIDKNLALIVDVIKETITFFSSMVLTFIVSNLFYNIIFVKIFFLTRKNSDTVPI